MSASTAQIAALGTEAVASIENALESPPPPPAPPPAPPRIGPVIPATAMAALRRISTRLRTPTVPPLPAGARDRAARVVVPVDVTIELDDGTRVKAVVRDISATGLFVVLPDALDVGADLTCELGLPAPGDPLSTTRHKAWARVVRKGEGGCGLELLDPEPELVEAISALSGG
jgi:hypothetical protein